MLTDQRQSHIRSELARHGAVQARALAARFSVSEDTIRRDLSDLARAGACTRVYGGAVTAMAASLSLREADACRPTVGNNREPCASRPAWAWATRCRAMATS